jgi:HAE1 family hydrophobic/amphiphilic exporter-1
VDFAVETQRERWKTPIEAIHDACLVWFRPITMTTFAAFGGTLPIALARESRRLSSLAVFGGLLMSQLLTLSSTRV